LSRRAGAEKGRKEDKNKSGIWEGSEDADRGKNGMIKL
jgi:hypothetical protein